MAELTNLNLAVLFDAENVPRSALGAIMQEVAIYGTPTVKRIYGDWTSPNVGGWKLSLLENAITPIQQYSYTQGKNSSDSAMIIDAMDILYTGHVDGFVLVSSDSDFTRLAIRLREAGMRVIGIGEKKTPKAFIASCDKFIYIEILRAKYDEPKRSEPSPRVLPPAAAASRPSAPAPIPASPVSLPLPIGEKPHKGPFAIPKDTLRLITDSIADIADDDGWAFMGELGNLLIKKKPDFDPRSYGFGKLTTLIKSIDGFEIDVRQTSDARIKHIYVRDTGAQAE